MLETNLSSISNSDLVQSYEKICSKIDELSSIEKSLLVYDAIKKNDVYVDFLKTTTEYIKKKIDIRAEMIIRMAK